MRIIDWHTHETRKKRERGRIAIYIKPAGDQIHVTFSDKETGESLAVHMGQGEAQSVRNMIDHVLKNEESA